MLIHFGITPYLVFDGDYLPSKAGTEKDRLQRRSESKKLGLELLKLGKTSQAHLELQKAVDVTPEMARLLIEELKYHGIQYVVAPYEADSQLVYLEKQGIIHGILSEDSDLLVFGAKCLITKLDKYGECVEINRNLFTACREVSLAGWSDADFRRMAMLSGCDYLPSIGKMGLKTAHRMMRKHKTVERVVKAAQFDGQFKVPRGYLDAFTQAERTFLYQWVFCPLTNQVVNLTTPESEVDVATMPYIGSSVPADIAIGVANGNLNPHTKEPIIVEAVDRSRTKPLKPARRVTPVQTPDLKQGKSIDSFFKPKRTPLAELDPNSFTPSPSQQALLEQQRQSSGGWAAVLAPTSTSQPQPRSFSARTAPPPARRSITDSLVRASAPHHAKRQRLCSQGSFETPGSSNVANERSRFFPSSVPDPSPSLRMGKHGKKKRTKSFELYSDDSFDEAIATLADLEETNYKSRKSISIFHDGAQGGLPSESQSTTQSRTTTADSQDTGGNGATTPATSAGSPTPEVAEETVFSAALSSKVKDFRARFAYSSSSAVLEDTSQSTFPPREDAARMKAQSRMKTSITTLGRVDTVSKATKSKSPSANTASHDESLGINDSAWAAMEAEVVVAASNAEITPTKPSASTFSSVAVPVQGSEDLLVPDSEAESESSPRKPTLDLGRFTFRG
jgi:exonuclease-1